MKSRCTWFSIVALGILILGVSLIRPFHDYDTTGGDSDDGDSDVAMVIHPALGFNS